MVRIVPMHSQKPKERILKAVADLPEDASVEDAIARLVVLQKVERGLEEVRTGKTVPIEDARARLKLRREGKGCD